MLSGLWAKVLAGGAIIGAILMGVLRIFSAGKESGQREAQEKVAQQAGEQATKVTEIKREGRKREREVKHADNPADFDRYR